MSLICSFDATKNRHYFYRGKDCIENFCKNLKELGTEIINCREKEMIPLTDGEISLMKSKKYATYAKKSFVQMIMRKMNLDNTKKSEIIAILQENLEELLIVFAI